MPENHNDLHTRGHFCERALPVASCDPCACGFLKERTTLEDACDSHKRIDEASEPSSRAQTHAQATGTTETNAHTHTNPEVSHPRDARTFDEEHSTQAAYEQTTYTPLTDHVPDTTLSLQLCVVDAFWRCFNKNQDDLSLAAVHALATVVSKCNAKNVLQLFVLLKAATEALEDYTSREDVLHYICRLTSVKRLTTLPLRSACLLYQQFAVKHYERKPDISVEDLKVLLIAQSAKFASRISQSKQTIADIGRIMLTKDQMVVLTHGRSSCVERLLCDAWQKHKKRFSVIATRHENGPDQGSDDVGALIASLVEHGIPAVSASVCSVGRLMARVDLVVVGTEAVSENGGIINRIGTATIAMVAHQYCVPFYVVCEACKFTRTHPLQQKDASKFCMQRSKHENLNLPIDCREFLDYTKPDYITLLFTDLGIFTPRSVSDELTKLFEKSK